MFIYTRYNKTNTSDSFYDFEKIEISNEKLEEFLNFPEDSNDQISRDYGLQGKCGCQGYRARRIYDNYEQIGAELVTVDKERCSKVTDGGCQNTNNIQEPGTEEPDEYIRKHQDQSIPSPVM